MGYANNFPGWEGMLLQLGGFPNTPQNRAFLAQWNSYEGSNATYNPLNTTQPAPGASTYNSVGVRNYPSAVTGLKATIQTFVNGHYPSIVQGLKSGDIYAWANQSTANQAGIAQNLGTWGSHNFAAVFQYEAAAPPDYLKTPIGTLPVSGPTQQSHFDPSTGQSTTSKTDAPSSGVLGALNDILNKPNLWIRAGEVVGGAALIILGVYLLARQVGLAPAIPSPVRAATSAVG